MPIRSTPSILSVWPGLPGLIRHGRWAFLALSAGFGVIAAGVVFTTGYWTALFPSTGEYWLIGGGIVSWIVLSVVAGELSHYYEKKEIFDIDGDIFSALWDHYLAADWLGAEKLAKKLLQTNPRDPEALLLLATLYRHTDRPRDAAATLERLEKLESADRWGFEISLERAAQRRMKKEHAVEKIDPLFAHSERDDFTDETPDDAIVAFPSPAPRPSQISAHR